MKKRYKLYKSGKLWCYAAILFGSLWLGTTTAMTTAHADSQVATPTSSQVEQAASVSEQAVQAAASSSQSATPALAENKVADTTANNSQADSTTPAANEVPVDPNASSSQVNFNKGSLDHYQLTENAQGQPVLHADGWQAVGRSNDQRYRYAILYDNTAHREVHRQAIRPVVRPDVARAYAGVANANYSGFDFDITLPNNVLADSLSLVLRYSDDPVNGEGKNTSYWFGPLQIDQANRAVLDSIHTDAAAGTVTVSGWHASNQAAGRPYHYVIAYDSTTHREIARVLVNEGVARPDVATAYPQIFNAARSGFSASFRLVPAMVRDQVQFLSRWTNDPAGNGSAVDYWFSPTSHANYGWQDSYNLSHGALTVSGWHANDASIYAPHHFLLVWDQTAHQQIAAHLVDTQASVDVARAHRDLRTADHARFSFDFGQLPLQVNHRYQLISRYSQISTGNGDNGTGCYVDYWYPAFTLDNQFQSWIDGFTTNGNTLTIHGWMANNERLSHPYAYVILLKGGKEFTRQRVDLTARQDVANAHPGIYDSFNSGFAASFDLAQVPMNQTGDLQFVLRFSNNATTGEGSYVDKYTQAYTSNAGWFDRIANTGHSLQLSGWHASTDVAHRPYQYIIAIDAANGHELHRWALSGSQINHVRTDLVDHYSWIPQAGHAGFGTELTDGYSSLRNHAFRLIHRFTNDAAGNGSYVDYYSGVVDLTDYAARLRNAWAGIIGRRAGHIGIAVKSQLTGQIYSYTNTPGYRWWMASTVKVSVLTELLHRTGGNLNGTEQNLATNMIRYSDNNATSTLVYNYFGGVGALGSVFRAEGMNETTPGNDGWGTTTTTPADQVKLLSDIYLGPQTNYINQRSRDYIHYQMSHVSYGQDWGISAGTGRGHFYIKNGWIPSGLMNINSIGFIPGGNNRGYCIAVYTDRGPSMGYSIDTIQQLARVTKQILQG